MNDRENAVSAEEGERRRLEAVINERLRRALLARSYDVVRADMDRVAAEIAPGWDWIDATHLGGPPALILTQRS